ncbi:MAG: peptidyl-prolyl cis-trans isomerase, partial [Nitrospinae bacterium]|nr:peptidyl-prolyl cis-trans isomerase [Nitrospinota bacterium]
ALASQRLTIDILKKKIEKQLLKEEFIRMEIVPGVRIEEAQVKSFYRENKDSFMKPGSYQVSHIFVSLPLSSEGQAATAEDRKRAEKILTWVKGEAKKKIDEAASKLKAGKKFAEVAREYSEDLESAAKGGDLGSLMKDQTLPEIAKVMTQMTTGKTSGVIESSFGFHIIQLNGKEPSRPTPLEEVKSDILNHLLKAKTQKRVQDYLSKLRKKTDIKIFI